jgi:membrane protein
MPRDAAQTPGAGRRALTTIDRWQRGYAPAAFVVALAKKFADDRASSFAAQLAYYAFFSLFPLLLVFVSVLGFVLEGNPEAQADVLDSALARIPVIGEQLRGNVQSLSGSGVALAVGLVGALWAGLAVTLALGRAFNAVWDVPRLDQPSGVKARLSGLATLAVLGIALIAASAGSGLASGGAFGSFGAKAGTFAVTVTIDAVVFLSAFALLTSGSRKLREFAPGVALATAGSLLLQAAGGWYVNHTILDASDTYGTFALVIGLLSWFWLGSHVLLLAAELDVVLHRRLWPRSLTGELTPADRVAMQRSAAAARRDEREEIDVRFEERG